MERGVTITKIVRFDEDSLAAVQAVAVELERVRRELVSLVAEITGTLSLEEIDTEIATDFNPYDFEV